jgi:hypothetical protein
MARRSGSEKRRRSKTYSLRLDPAEQERAAALRDRAGLPLSALLRRALFDTPLPRAARRPTINHQAVARLLGELGKIGTNINQLAKHANAGRYQQDSIELALRDLMELRTACMQALGREPDRSPPDP